MGMESLFRKMQKVLEMGGEDGSIAVCMCLVPLNGAHKNGYDGKFYVVCILPQFKRMMRVRKW